MSIQIPWDLIVSKHAELEQKLPHLTGKERIQVQKDLVRLNRFLEKKRELDLLDQEGSLVDAQLGATLDPEMKQLFDQEKILIDSRRNELLAEVERMAIPPAQNDERSVFLEIRAGTGGQEAALFASDLMQMYMNYALAKGWKVDLVDQVFTDLGGIRSVVLHIQGDDVYGHLKFEAGVHRVQRVPKTETAGRVHTSTATVAVLPEADEVDVSINPADLRIDVYRASGAGGQHVNTTDSAVRITHIPSGVVVACQDERSQHKNKAKALKVLQSRLFAFEEERHAQEMGKQRKEMVGAGTRSEKIRTYNFPQNRITDHQVELTLKKLDRVMEGDLDEIIDALRLKEREARRVLAFS